MKTIPVMTLRRKTGQVLDEISRGHEPVTIARGEHPLVVMVPYEDFRSSATNADGLRRAEDAFAKLDEWRQKHGHKLREFDPVGAIRQIRDKR